MKDETKQKLTTNGGAPVVETGMYSPPARMADAKCDIRGFALKSCIKEVNWDN
jgi:catalase